MIDQMYQDKKKQIKGSISSRQLENVVINRNGGHLGGTRSEIKPKGR